MQRTMSRKQRDADFEERPDSVRRQNIMAQGYDRGALSLSLPSGK